MVSAGNNRIGSVFIHLGVTTDMAKFTRAGDEAVRVSNRMRNTIVAGNQKIADSFTRAGQAVAVMHGPLGGVASRLQAIAALSRGATAGMAAFAAGSAAATFGLAKFVQAGDKMQRMANNLRTVTNSSAELADVQKQLFDVSQRSRSMMEGTVTLYARMARSTEGLGLSQQKLLRITETVQKAFAVGGATQQEALGAAIQLSQGIASDRFSGEEFRSVAENAPVLLREMARQLGVNIGKLREMAHAGRLTGEVVTKAILGASEAIDRDFGKTVSTVEQSMSRLWNSIDQYVYEADKTYGVTQTLASGINALADNFQDLMEYVEMAAIGLAAFGGGRIAGAAAKAGAAFASDVAMNGLFAKSRRETKKQLDEINKDIEENGKKRALIAQEIAAATEKYERRAIEMTARHHQGLKAAREAEVKAFEETRRLAAQRVSLTQQLEKVHAQVVARLKAEQAEQAKLVQQQAGRVGYAARRFGASNLPEDLAKLEKEQKRLTKAKEEYRASVERVKKAEKDTFAAFAPKKYADEIRAVNKELAANQQAHRSTMTAVLNGQNATRELMALDEQRIGITQRIAAEQRRAHAAYISQLKAEQAEILKAISRRVQIGTAGMSPRAARQAQEELIKLQKAYGDISDKISAQQKIAFNPEMPRKFQQELIALNREMAKNEAAREKIMKRVSAGEAAQERLNRLSQEGLRLNARLAELNKKAFESGVLKEYGAEAARIQQELSTNFKEQVAAGQKLVKVQRDYLLAQQQSPEIAKKVRAELDRHVAAVTTLKQRNSQLLSDYHGLLARQAELNRLTTAWGAAMLRVRGFMSGMWNLLGGGPGAALMAAFAGFGYVSTTLARSAQASEEFRERLIALGYAAEDTAKSLKSLDEMSFSMLVENLEQAREELAKLKGQDSIINRLFGDDHFAAVIDQVNGQLNELVNNAYYLTAAGVSVEERLERIANLEAFKDLIREIEETDGAAGDLDERLAAIGEKDRKIAPLVNQVERLLQRVRETAKYAGDTERKIEIGFGEPPAWLQDQSWQTEQLRLIERRREAIRLTEEEYRATNIVTKAEEERAKVRKALLKELEDYREKHPEVFKGISDEQIVTDSLIDSLIEQKRAMDVLNDAYERQKKRVSEMTDHLVEKFMDGELSAGQLYQKLDALQKMNPDLSPWFEQLRTLIGWLKKANDEADKWPMAPSKGGRVRYGQINLPDRVDEVPTPRVDPYFDDLTKGEKAYRDLIQSARDRIEQMKLEAQVAHLAGIEQEALRFRLELLQKAQEKGRHVSEEERKEIERLVEEYRKYAEVLALAEAQAQILHDRSLIGLSDGDKEIIAAVERRGLTHTSQAGRIIAAELRVNQVMEQTQKELKDLQAIGKEAFTSLLDLLYETGDIGEKLIGIFAGIGKQFAQMGMERLWKWITGEDRSMFDGGGGSFSSMTPVQTQQMGREIGNAIAPAITDSLKAPMDAYAAAIRKVESGSYEGNYGAIGPLVKGDRAYGAYQVMGKNIASWTKEVTGTAMSVKEFLSDRAAQDKVFFTKFGQSLDKFGNFADATSVWFSGRPLSKAGNASDGYNTTPQYVQKAQTALDNYPGIRTGVRDGTIDAAKRLSSQSAASGSSQESAPGIFDTRLNSGIGVGMAGLGAFFGGMQSGDPLSGALSGAMTGFGAAPMIANAFPAIAGVAGIVGVIGGGLLGLIGGLIGRSRQKKKELQQARQELESQMGAITQLIATATGNFMGEYEKSLMETSDEFAKAIQMAQKAKNTKLVNELKAAQEQFFQRTAENWTRSFEGMISSLKSGLNFESEFMSGFDAVEKMRESLVGFVNDAKMFAESGGDLAAYVAAQRGRKDPTEGLNKYQAKSVWEYQDVRMESENEFVEGYLDLAHQMFEVGIQVFNESGGQLYATLEQLKKAAHDAGYEIDETGRIFKNVPQQVEDAVESAREAAIANALALLRGAETFSEMEEAVQKLQGAAANLPTLLRDLGMSAEDAAAAIEDSMLVAMDKLRRSLRDDLQRSINSLADMDFLNDLWDAQLTFKDRLKDLAALGMKPSLAFEELALRVRQVAKDAELTDEQLKQLAATFPEIGGAILGALGVGSTGSALADAKAALEEAKSNLRSAYEAEKTSIEQVISRLQTLSKSLRNFLNELRLDSNLSPLDPFERLQEAQRRFQETAAKALTGDEEALGNLEQVSRDYLTEAKAYYASSTQYFSIFEEVEAILSQALTVSDRQLSEAEQQLATLEAQTGQLLEINDGVTSVAEALEAYHKAQADYNAAQLAYEAYQAQLFEQMIAIMGQMRAPGAGDANAAAAYLAGNPDIVQAINQGFDAGTGSTDIGTIAKAHWEQHGQFENRQTPYGEMTRGGRYLMNNPDVLAAIRAGWDGGTGIKDIEQLAKLHWDMHGQYEGRLHPYKSGGFTGFGDVNKVAGVVHGQEFVMHAEATRRWRPQLERMNAGLDPFANDNGSLVSELRAVNERLASIEAELGRNTAVTAAGAQGQIAAVEGTTRAIERNTEKMWANARGWRA